VPQPQKLEKAQLVEIDSKFKDPLPGGRQVEVQFNPETLKVTYANQLATSGTGDQKGGASTQFVGAGTTKLAAQLWFDVSSQTSLSGGADDVRQLTRDVSFFISPKTQADNTVVAPALRFRWGAFQFDGVMDALEETFELFSPAGKPLRSSISFSMTQQKILRLDLKGAAPLGAPMAGTVPRTPAAAGQSLQGVVASAGLSASWQAVAQANGIENPRLLQPGQLLRLDAGASAGAGVSAGAGFTIG
jgi:contractile injection system tube protein